MVKAVKILTVSNWQFNLVQEIFASIRESQNIYLDHAFPQALHHQFEIHLVTLSLLDYVYVNWKTNLISLENRKLLRITSLSYTIENNYLIELLACINLRKKHYLRKRLYPNYLGDNKILKRLQKVCNTGESVNGA